MTHLQQHLRTLRSSPPPVEQKNAKVAKRRHLALHTALRLSAVVFLTYLFLGSSAVADEIEPHHLVSNFTSPLGNSPTISTSVDLETPRVGLGTGRLKYTLTDQQRRGDLMLPDEQIRLGGSGKIRLWIKGDGSSNQLLLILRRANIVYDPNTGTRRLQAHQNINLTPIVLDFDDWRDVELDGSKVAASTNVVTWWHRIQVVAPNTPEAKLSGEILLDEFRILPVGSPPNSTYSVSLLGETVRDYTRDISVALDVRNFTDQSARVSVRLTMSDRNDNTVADQDLAVELKSGASQEVKLQLEPDALHAYLPPFKLDGDVLSAELPGVSKKFDYTIVMGNAWLMWDDMSDVDMRWRTAKFDVGKQLNNWVAGWTHGQGARATPFVETKTHIRRVERSDSGENTPPGRYGIQIDYQGHTAAYVTAERYLPGNAYRAGFWVKGNGTPAKLHALFLDFSNLAGFYGQMWARIPNGEREVCTLDFDGWRFFEVSLPGEGNGTWIPGGSTQDVDFPLELTALRIQPAEESATGSVQIGPVMVTSQLSITETLNVHIGYDDAAHEYDSKHGAWLTVHNGWREGVRRINTRWTLLDRYDTAVASGTQRVEVPAGQSSQVRVDLAAHADKIGSRAGPLKLEAVVSDAEDATTSAQRQIILSKPDSRVLLSDFESDRGYLGLRGEGISNAPPEGEAAARTTTSQKHSGQRSLGIEWDKAANVTRFVSIDPPTPGIPSRISAWVFGDGSNVLFYPLIGDQPGISQGSGARAWDYFFCRQEAVRVDWQGWKQLTFQLPPIPIDWPEGNVTPWVQDYPLGIHLAVDASDTQADKGTLYVDDVVLDSHLPPAERLSVQLLRDDETNVFQAGQPLRFRVSNLNASQPARVKVEGGILDWRGRAVAAVDETLQLTPGQSQIRDLTSQLPQGAWELRVKATPVGSNGQPVEDAAFHKELVGDIIVADLTPILTANWRDTLRTDWKLRAPIRSRFRYVDEDWDWIEFHPGNYQFDSLRKRAAMVRESGNDPWMLLGFSAYYASGTGFEQMQAGSFERRQRDIGHAVDTFLVPKRIEDWDNYIAEVMRAAGKDLTGWVLWDNPDGTSSLKVPASKFSQMLASAARWRSVYCPETPLLIGGMRPQTGIRYLKELEAATRKRATDKYLNGLGLSAEEREQLEQDNNEASPETVSPRVVEARKRIAQLESQQFAVTGFTGINLRMDVGRLSPEDARVVETIDEYRRYLSSTKPAQSPDRTILVTDLDWAVERGSEGLGAFEQAAYLARSDLLLHPFGIRPSLDVRNQDHERTGLGLVYRRTLESPPVRQQLQSYQLKPGWWGTLRLRQLLDDAEHVAWIPMADEYPGRTRCQVLKRKSNGGYVVTVWRNDDSGFLSVASTGMTIANGEDVLGTRIAPESDRWPIGKMPTLLTVAGNQSDPVSALRRLRVDDGSEPRWYQRVLLSVAAAQASPVYKQESGEVSNLEAVTSTGIRESHPILRFPAGGTESLTVSVPDGASLVLRKKYYLDETGQVADVLINGESAGRWNLSREAKNLRSGIRTATFLIDATRLSGDTEATIQLHYATPANTISWTCLEYREGDFPLTAVGAIHADQGVQAPRHARNMVGSPLKIRNESYTSGIGCFAPCLLEYALNGQYSRFTAACGIDAATDGRGSVQFRVEADGKTLWTSPVMSGLDQPQQVDVDVTGVKRLRLVITDAEDGNRFDVGNWCDAVLIR